MRTDTVNRNEGKMKTQVRLDSFGFLTCELALRSRAKGISSMQPIPTHICLRVETPDAPSSKPAVFGNAEYAEAIFEAQEAAA